MSTIWAEFGPMASTANTATWIIGALSVFAALAGGARAAPPQIEAGEWRLGWNMVSMQGATGIPPEFLDLQNITATRCLGHVPLLPMPTGLDRGCRLDLEQAAGDAVAWRGACETADSASQVHGTIHYRGARLDGNVTIQTRGVAMQFAVQGKRTGARCP
jgi:hypothetical protein